MSCESPRLLIKQGIRVRCGKCFSCRRAHAAEWATRLTHELEYWPHDHCFFLTLTYNPLHHKDDNVLDVKDLQLFLKRLRKSTGDKVKYFAAGEYGSLRGRKHWHLILFSTKCSVDDVLRAWSDDKGEIGFIDAKFVEFRNCYYVSMYVSKAYSTLYNDKPPVYTMSQGLGKRWAMEHQYEFSDGRIPRSDGQLQTVPRQYRRWLFFDVPQHVLSKMIEDRRKRYASLIRGRSLFGAIRLMIDSESASQRALNSRGKARR